MVYTQDTDCTQLELLVWADYESDYKIMFYVEEHSHHDVLTERGGDIDMTAYQDSENDTGTDVSFILVLPEAQH